MKNLISTMLITTMAFTSVAPAVNAVEQEPITQTQSIIMDYDVVGGDYMCDSDWLIPVIGASFQLGGPIVGLAGGLMWGIASAYICNRMPD